MYRFLAVGLLLTSGLFAEDAATFTALDRAWAKAALSKDIAGLDRLLAGDLVYAHASGVVDTKASYLEKIKGGKQVYKAMDQKKVSVRIHGDSAITQSWMRVTGVNPQGPFDDKVMLLHVWVKQAGQWRLAAHQTARVDQIPD